VDAPTAGSIILAGVLLKMGTYGFLRFSLPIFPDATLYFATPIVILSIVAIIYGAFLAIAQEDIKKLIAYSSVSHMGFITMGLFLLNKNGIEGGILQMFNHGITTGALFLCVGFIYERTHSRKISDYGWGAQLMPWYFGFLFIFALASLGFPGTNGFIGELLILFGAWAVYKPYIIFLLIGIVFGAAYILWLFQRMTFGKQVGGGHGHGDDGHGDDGDETPSEVEIDGHMVRIWDVMNPRELVVLVTLVIFVFWVGFQPMPFLEIMHESVEHLIGQVNG
jgi:NADH-quinone oxidoreductase subunit M